MQIFKLLAPAALVALANAQFHDDEQQFDILARDETPGYEDLGVFIRDLDNSDDFLELEVREAEADPEELIFSSDDTDIIIAREADAFGDFDSLVELEGRDAEPEAEAEAEAEADPKKKKSKKNKKKGKKRKAKKCKKGKKGAKCRAKRKARKAKAKAAKARKNKKSPAQKKKAAALRKAEKLDALIWGF